MVVRFAGWCFETTPIDLFWWILQRNLSPKHTHHLHWPPGHWKHTPQLLSQYSKGTSTFRYFKGRNMHTILSPEDFIFWVVTGKIHAQIKPEEDQMLNEIIEQKDSGFSNTQSFSVTLCCPVTCIDNSSWIKCQHYHRQLCCWHAFAISLKIPLIFWLHNSWATPHLNIQKSILFKPN